MIEEAVSTSPARNRSNASTTALEGLVRRSGFASLAAAVLIAASQLLGLAFYTYDMPMSEAVQTAPALIYNLLKLAGFVLLLLGLAGLHARQSGQGGVLGLAGFLIAFSGTVLVAGDWWYEAFVVPWLAEIAPQVLEVPPSGLLIAGARTGFAIFAVGWVLFGIASMRARIFPRRASIVLMAGGVLGYLAGYPPFLLVLAVGIGWMGYWLQNQGGPWLSRESAPFRYSHEK